MGAIILAQKYFLGMRLSLRLKRGTFVILCRLSSQPPSSLIASTHTPSFGSGLMVMTTMHTQRTERSWSKWPLMLVMLFTLFMELSLIQLIQQISTLLLEQLMIGTRVFWERFAFTTELRDTGRYGFILPPDQIIESGEEIWAAMEVIIKQLLTL